VLFQSIVDFIHVRNHAQHLRLVDKEDGFLLLGGFRVPQDALEALHVGIHAEVYIFGFALEHLAENLVGQTSGHDVGLFQSTLCIEGELVAAVAFKCLDEVPIDVVGHKLGKSVDVRWLVVRVKAARLHFQLLSKGLISNLNYLVLRLVSQHSDRLAWVLLRLGVVAVNNRQRVQLCVVPLQAVSQVLHTEDQFVRGNPVQLRLQAFWELRFQKVGLHGMETVVSPEQEGRSVLLLDFGLVNEGVWDLVSLQIQVH